MARADRHANQRRASIRLSLPMLLSAEIEFQCSEAASRVRRLGVDAVEFRFESPARRCRPISVKPYARLDQDSCKTPRMA